MWTARISLYRYYYYYCFYYYYARCEGVYNSHSQCLAQLSTYLRCHVSWCRTTSPSYTRLQLSFASTSSKISSTSLHNTTQPTNQVAGLLIIITFPLTKSLSHLICTVVPRLRWPPLLPGCSSPISGVVSCKGNIYTKLWDLAPDFDSLITGGNCLTGSHNRGTTVIGAVTQLLMHISCNASGFFPTCPIVKRFNHVVQARSTSACGLQHTDPAQSRYWTPVHTQCTSDTPTWMSCPGTRI